MSKWIIGVRAKTRKSETPFRTPPPPPALPESDVYVGCRLRKTEHLIWHLTCTRRSCRCTIATCHSLNARGPSSGCQTLGESTNCRPWSGNGSGDRRRAFASAMHQIAAGCRGVCQSKKCANLRHRYRYVVQLKPNGPFQIAFFSAWLFKNSCIIIVSHFLAKLNYCEINIIICCVCLLCNLYLLG